MLRRAGPLSFLVGRQGLRYGTMALNGNAYAVDLDRMRSACGSRDETLLSDILERQGDLFACYAEQLDGEDESGFSFRQALMDIIEGVHRAPGSRRFLYGYAIELLCRHFGEVIPVPGDEQFAEIGDPEDLEIGSPLVNGELPLPVPSWCRHAVRPIPVSRTGRTRGPEARENGPVASG